jgi:hypothetical protein
LNKRKPTSRSNSAMRRDTVDGGISSTSLARRKLLAFATSTNKGMFLNISIAFIVPLMKQFIPYGCLYSFQWNLKNTILIQPKQPR